MNKQAYEHMVGLALDKQAMYKQAIFRKLFGLGIRKGINSLGRFGGFLSNKGADGGWLSGIGNKIKGYSQALDNHKGLKNFTDDLTTAFEKNMNTTASDYERYGNGLTLAKYTAKGLTPYALVGAGYMAGKPDKSDK